MFDTRLSARINATFGGELPAMVPKNFETAFEQVTELATRFADNESAYLSPRYQEAEVRQDFLDKFFVALGWDVYHQEHPNPYEREVKIEKSVMVGDRGKRADYAFYTRPNFLQARFMAEAKKPARQLENPYDCFQAMRYGWNSNTPLAVLTDFEQFLVLDSRYKPSVEKAANGIIEKFHYSQFFDEESFRKIYYLFSREAVGDNSLEKFITGLKKAKTAKAAKVAPAVQIQPVGDTFLNELDVHRSELAQGFKRKNPELDGDELTEITQRTLDRLVFIRFLEDKLVEPSEIIDRLGVKSGSKWRDFAAEVPRLNAIYNGIIFKPHSILDSPDFQPDEKAFADTLSWLSHKNSAYDFNTIPIHILGSIYERFLGKTIVVTDKRAKLEEKPEVRKAGGVYYTPEYIVRYIVENTIGKLLSGEASSFAERKSSAFPKGAPIDPGGSAAERRHSLEEMGGADGEAELRRTSSGIAEKKVSRKTPEEISKMRFADIACGSGSFLLGIFDYLIKYHVDWYDDGNAGKGARVPSRRRAAAIKAGLCRETAEGNLQLTLTHKRDILLNNIYGVDLDAQAVEVAQLSLYLKLLEEETTATAQQYLAGFREQLLPSLHENIVHGNSLIDYDIMDHPLFRSVPGAVATGAPSTSPVTTVPGTDTLRKLRPMSFKDTFPEVFATGGFDAIVGNPPWGADFSEVQLAYLRRSNSEIIVRMIDSFMYFVYQAFGKLGDRGMFGMIVPDVLLYQLDNRKLREFILSNSKIDRMINVGDVFEKVVRPTAILIAEKHVSVGNFENKIKIADFSHLKKEVKADILANFTDYGEVAQSDLLEINGSLFVTKDPEKYKLLQKLSERQTKHLIDFVDEDGIQRGVSPDLKKAFLVSKETAIECELESEKLRNVLTGGRQVRRYHIEYPDLLLIYTANGDNFNLIPKICDYVDQFRGEITCKEVLQKKHSIYALHRARKESIFNKREKILGVITEDEIIVSLDTNQTFATDGLYLFGITGEVSSKYLMGLLNSRLFVFIYRLLSSETGRTLAQVKPTLLNQLPIRTIDFNNPAEKAMHDRTVELVEKMIEAKKSFSRARTDSDRTFYERLCTSLDNQIDDLVYQLYDITPDERKIIEKS